MQIGDQCSGIGAGKGLARQLEGGAGRRVATRYEGFGWPAKAAEKDGLFVARPVFRDGAQGFDGIVGRGAGRQVQGKAVGQDPVLAIDQRLAGEKYFGHGVYLAGLGAV